MYHRVLPRADALRRAVEPGMYVAPETFARHLDWLASEFHVLPLFEIVERLDRGSVLPPAACAITFDDGWRDNLEHALPLLQSRGMPATLFAVTGRIGTRGAFWPDEVMRRLRAAGRGAARELASRLGAGSDPDPASALLAHLKALPQPRLESALDLIRSATPATDEDSRELLDWGELEVLQRGGIDVESHAATHAILTQLDPAAAGRELRSSLDALRARGLGRRRLLAYPSGQADARIRELAAEAGYRAALTTENGLASRDCGLFALPRLGLHDDVSRTRSEFNFAVPGTARAPELRGSAT